MGCGSSFTVFENIISSKGTQFDHFVKQNSATFAAANRAEGAINSSLESCINIEAKQVILRFSSLLKHSRSGKHQKKLILSAYSEPDLCIVDTLKEYLKRTRAMRPKGTSNLFITTTKPFRKASLDTISNWAKRLLRSAGIDLSVYGAHSTRAASPSSASKARVSISSNLATAGWTQESTFRQYYLKPVERERERVYFAATLLELVSTFRTQSIKLLLCYSDFKAEVQVTWDIPNYSVY